MCIYIYNTYLIVATSDQCIYFESIYIYTFTYTYIYIHIHIHIHIHIDIDIHIHIHIYIHMHAHVLSSHTKYLPTISSDEICRGMAHWRQDMVGKLLVVEVRKRSASEMLLLHGFRMVADSLRCYDLQLQLGSSSRSPHPFAQVGMAR